MHQTLPSPSRAHTKRYREVSANVMTRPPITNNSANVIPTRHDRGRAIAIVATRFAGSSLVR
ncbi:MAG TPA: hypothetical protein VGH87_09045 [Polyangiaceae bacterium]|nr:hypothetical protein [Polyangiaceae bacterium]